MARPQRASTRAPTRHASVAGSAAHHQRTADVAGGRISHLDKFPERLNRIRALAIRRWQSGHRKAVEQFALVTAQEFEVPPAPNVVHKGLGVADLGIAGPAAGLEASMREFAAQHLEPDTVLQRQRHRCGKRIHQPGDGRALLRHGDEDLPGQTVVVNSDREISFLPGDGEMMGKCPPLVRQPPTNRRRRTRSCALALTQGAFGRSRVVV